MKRDRALLLAKLAVSAGLLWVVYSRIPLSDFRAHLQAFRPIGLVPIFALLLVNSLLSAWKWQILLRADGLPVPLPKLFGSYLIGTFFNIFLPSSIGGDAYRVYDLARYTEKLPNAFASVLADRLSGFLALVILALVASIPVAVQAGMPLLVAIPVVAGIAITVGIFILSHPAATGTFMRLTRLGRITPLARFVEKCSACFVIYSRKPGVVARIMAISFAFQLSVIFCVYLMGTSLGIRASFLYYAAFVPIICLLEALPISIYGLGVRDAAYAFFFGLVGFGKIQTRALALLFLIINVCYALVGGVLFLLKRGRTAADAAPAEAKRLTPGRITLVSVVLTVALWALFAWPLPRHMGTGIPSSPRNVEKYNTRAMMPGDHLQLLYHFRLASDMLTGKIPLMQNPYEFNTGDDTERFEPGPFYFPFSAVFAAAAALGGQAFGWNLTGLLALIVTYLATWRLARRFTVSERVAAFAALVSIALPYRWIVVLGGSPTGFAMTLVPLLFWGLDVAARDGKISGGIAAGVAILLAFCSDLHVFFFSVLATPFWCILALTARTMKARLSARACRRIAVALIPVIVLGLAAFWLSRITARELAGADMGKGWALREIARYSPWPRGLFRWENMGITNQVYVGITMPLLLTLGALSLLLAAFQKPIDKRWQDNANPTGSRHAALGLLVLLALGLVLAVSLALGTNGPFKGGLLELCRTLVPPYRMVRQTAKVYCLVPTLLAVAGALSLSALADTFRKAGTVLCVIFALALVVESRFQVNATVCVLDRAQPAYAAVAVDAHASGQLPRALALPLWPGNSHWSSLNQYYASVHRVRMVNGYRPAVARAYRATFRRLESANQGLFSDAQLNWLLERGIGHVLLHEDAFPEKVSPFPVAITLGRLLEHPRLELLEQHEQVWAFRVLAEPDDDARIETGWDLHFPSRRWEAERVPGGGVAVKEDREVSGGRYAELSEEGAHVVFNLRAPIVGSPALRYLLRVRGGGSLDTTVLVDGVATATTIRDIDDPAWNWIAVPVPTDAEFFTPALKVTRADGWPEIDMCLLAAGEWHGPPRGEALDVPVPSFFHAGYTDANAVVLRKDAEPDRVVLYGPMMPMDIGAYEIQVGVLSLDPPHPTRTDGTGPVLGLLSARLGDDEIGRIAVFDGYGNRLACEITNNLPFRLDFAYTREADMRIDEISIQRLEE